MQSEVSIRDLSEQLAAWEQNKERDKVTPKERKRLYTALHQTHLPKMDTLNVVDYDRNRGVVSLTEHINQFDIYLDVVAADDLPWGQFYLALGGVVTALVSVAALGITPFGLLSGFDYAFVVAVLFTTVAAYQTIRDRKQIVGKNVNPPDVCHPPQELTEEELH